MPLVIETGVDRGVYDRSNLRVVLDAVAVIINGKYAGLRVKNGPLPMLHSIDYFRFASIEALALFMLEVNQYRVPNYANLQPPANMPAPALVFGAEHGDLHFGGDPTEQKSKWSLPKPAAIQLMATEIGPHLVRMRRESRIAGWESWYVGGQAPGNIGQYYVRGVRGGESTRMFTIQAQVNWLENEISYHGFPDERLLREGLGKTRNSIM